MNEYKVEFANGSVAYATARNKKEAMGQFYKAVRATKI